MSDESDIGTSRDRRKRKNRYLEVSSDSDSSIGTTKRKRRKRKQYIKDSDSESDSSIEIVHKKRIGRVTSDTDGSTSGSEIVRSKKTVATLADSDSDTDSEYDSDWITEPEILNNTNDAKKTTPNAHSSSESGDDQLDKCPICLLPFKNQEVGSPESCDHSFCIDCILEWSKNVNTCPVDRQFYNLILVRSEYNGKIVRQIPVEPVQQQNGINEIVDDPTFCEICGRSDREDRMLLCDGCDLGFHLECLHPPLVEVPPGLWFCPDCGPGDEDNTVDIYEVHLLWEDAQTLGWPTGPRARNTTTRLLPRTRQSERVRARVITHRNQRRQDQNEQQEAAQLAIAGGTSSQNRSNRRRKKRKRRGIKITYEMDQVTGQRVAIETKIRRRKNRRQRERARMVAQASKSVKRRLALQLGLSCRRNGAQCSNDSRSTSNNSNIGYQRSQAGIPTLDLFGQRDDMDYYGGTDSEEDVASNNLLIRRRPHASDVSLFRRAARRKAIALPIPQPSPINVLDNILDIQAKFHSKNSVISVDYDGSVKIDSKEGPLNPNRANKKEKHRNRLNLNDYTNAYFRQTPLYGPGNSTSASVYSSNSDFTRRDSGDNRPTVTTSSEQVVERSESLGQDEDGQGCSSQQVCSSYDSETEKKEIEKSRSNTPGTHNSDSELDIYSDIEPVSTSRAEEYEAKPASPITGPLTPNTPTDDDANNSDGDLIIDTEKVDDSKEQVSSTVDLAEPTPVPQPVPTPVISEIERTSFEIQNQTVQSSNSKLDEDKDDKEEDEDDDSEDGCPNFSIYSSESISIAKTTDVNLLSTDTISGQSSNTANTHPAADRIPLASTSLTNTVDDICRIGFDTTPTYSYSKSESMKCGLYSDSEDESIIKITQIPARHIDKEEPELATIYKTAQEHSTNSKKSFGLGDIRNMTEDISEEERSYTPCLDERSNKQGLEGLDTEMISDDDRNDFDESHEQRTASEGDALEINAKESELDFTSKPEDCEEGEIPDKNKKAATITETPHDENVVKETEKEPEKPEESSKDEKKEQSEIPHSTSFKKLSRSNKERNYRDKDKENARSKSRERKSDKENRKKKEKRKDLERYNVRSIIQEKPRRVLDKFGRDKACRRSPSRSSRSLTPPPRRSISRGRSYSRERSKKKKRARTKTRSRSPIERRRSRTPRSRRQKSRSRLNSRERPSSREKRRWREKSRESASPNRRKEWGRQSPKGWSRSRSRSYTPEKQLTPSWTPPRVLEPQPVKPQNLTVILNNDHNQKKKDKRKKDKRKESEKGKKRKKNKTPPPSKEVFASGNNILVSVSFNKEKNQRDVIAKRKREVIEEAAPKKARKIKEKRPKSDSTKRKKKKKELEGVKPVAIIDLDRSPFREVTPSPEDVIVLTDSENAESNDMLGLQKAICDSSQQVASPERPSNANYLTGPKTPPEPQVKFTLNPKQTQMRAISNPLHEPDDIEEEINPEEELDQRLNETLHKGPNTPPEPPNSPPSSPDAYDPFEPTKSRSPTPEPLPPPVQLSSTSQNENVREEKVDSRKSEEEPPEKSHTPPAITDIQPADSQCSNTNSKSPEKSPEQHIGVVINRVVQSQAAIFPTVASKAVSSFSNTSMVTSTPMAAPRINILSSTVLTPTIIASALPQRIVLPNTTKSSPVKVSPTKLPIKSTPIKPMPAKGLASKARKTRKLNNAGNENAEAALEIESPYSPGSSDYEDLFEPPSLAEGGGGKNTNKQQGTAQKPAKDQTTFDVLFGSSPVNNSFKNNTKKGKSANNAKHKKNVPKGTKQVGVKIDEDTLKILDELPNSAVEMQVKYKYLKKLNRQERVVEEVKLVLKPHYNKKHINKEEYKDILRRTVPKICHNKSGEINPQKIQNLVEAYVKKIRHSKKVTSSSSSVNPQKV